MLTPLLLAAALAAVAPGPSLHTPRAGHQTTLLADGRLLLSGGCSGPSCSPVERSTELLDPARGASRPAAPLGTPRVAHAAVLLDDGSVLVLGGWTGTTTTATAERYAGGRFQPVGALQAPRMDASATRLTDGSVLVVGGASATNQPLAEAERYLPAPQGFVAAGRLAQARAHHTATLLADGRVLVAGGLRGRNQGTASAELYDPRSGRFEPVAALRQPRCKHAALRLPDGRVLLIGGSPDCGERQRIAETEIYDPQHRRFEPGPRLLDARYKIVGASTVLPDGTVLVAGDADDVEVWRPGTPGFVKLGGGPGQRLAFSSASLLPDGRVLLTGGYDDAIRPTAQTWVIRP